jgi:hypothetical protein
VPISLHHEQLNDLRAHWSSAYAIAFDGLTWFSLADGRARRHPHGRNGGRAARVHPG